jgi:alpha-ribazole phosphatase
VAPLTLWLLRHAEVPAGQGLCYGRLDLAADETATRYAAAVFDRALPHLPTAAWVSPRQRCRQMAQALQHPELHWQGEDPRLGEMDFGAWEGRPWDSLTPADFAPWMDNFTHHRVGGSGDSVSAVLDRVRAALNDTVAHCERGGHTQALWVAHAGVARAVQVLLEGPGTVSTVADWPREAPSPGQWRVFSVPAATAAARPA